MAPPEPTLAELRALHVLLETGSVTVAARRLGTSQPAMSRTLARLRALFGDPLLAPSGRGLAATPRAREVLPRVERALLAARAVLDPHTEPAAPQPWTLAASDYGFQVVLRDFVAASLAREPLREIRVATLGLETMGALARGEVDVALAPKVDVQGLDEYVFRPLLRDPYAVVLRPGHPALAHRLTLPRYLALEHVAVRTAVPGRSVVHLALAREGHQRRIAVQAPSLTAALELVAATDLVGTFPAAFVAAHARPLATRAPPFAVDPVALHLVFLPQNASDPRHRALRERLLAHVARRPLAPA